MVRFLDGKNSSVLQELEREMEAAAENLEFERAADLRDRLRGAQGDRAGEGRHHAQVDQDVVGFARDDGNACIQLFFMRDGQLAPQDAFLMQDAEGESDRAVLTSFVKQFYRKSPTSRSRSCCRMSWTRPRPSPSGCARRRGRKVELSVPAAARSGGSSSWRRRTPATPSSSRRPSGPPTARRPGEAALQLQEALNLPRTPRRIECYDISHVQGTSQVASMVVFEDGKPKRSDYKRFRIKHQEGNNDFLSMQEVVRAALHAGAGGGPGTERMGEAPSSRAAFAETAHARADRAIEPYPLGPERQRHRLPTHHRGRRDGRRDRAEPPGRRPRGGVRGHTVPMRPLRAVRRERLGGRLGRVPRLVIIDGGKGQLSAAVEVMDSLELSEIPIVGLAKEREEIFQKHRSEPGDPAAQLQGLYLVQRIRDEAHRFAITYHRNVRAKEPAVAARRGARRRPDPQEGAAQTLRLGQGDPRGLAGGAGGRAGDDPAHGRGAQAGARRVGGRSGRPAWRRTSATARSRDLVQRRPAELLEQRRQLGPCCRDGSSASRRPGPAA